LLYTKCSLGYINDVSKSNKSPLSSLSYIVLLPQTFFHSNLKRSNHKDGYLTIPKMFYNIDPWCLIMRPGGIGNWEALRALMLSYSQKTLKIILRAKRWPKNYTLSLMKKSNIFVKAWTNLYRIPTIALLAFITWDKAYGWLFSLIQTNLFVQKSVKGRGNISVEK
jgi:hypothetical protein